MEMVMVDPKTDKRTLDERGAILVLGIMLGAILVGALFYVIGVGHAVVWREAVQDAADATAFDAVAWNARGLNVVVAINIFMAIVMGILLAYRVALLFVTIMAVLAGVACVLSVFVPPLSAACTVAPHIGRVAARMGAREPKLANKIFKTLSALHKGQQLISSATPLLSVAQSSLRNSSRPGVGMAIAVSTQMLPATVLDGMAGAMDVAGGALPLTDPGFKSGEDEADFRAGGGSCKNKKKCCNNGNKGPKNKQRKERKAKPLMGIPFSLPAEESLDENKFCDKAAKKMGDPILMVVKEMVGIGADTGGGSGFFSKIFGFLVGGSSPLCGGINVSGTSGGAANDIAKKHYKDACEQRYTSECDNKEPPKTDPATNQPLEAFKCDGGKKKAVDRCVKDMEKKGGKPKSGFRSAEVEMAQDQGRAEVEAGFRAGAKSRYGEIAWADVWGPMANGTVFTQTWALVRAERDNEGINKGIEIAASFGGGSSSAVDDDDTNTTIAQAEIYFDTDKDWDGAVDVAMWTMNWRARLRRVHSPLEMALGPIEQAISGIVKDVFNADPVKKIVGGSNLAKFFEDADVSLIPSSVSDPLETLREETASQGGGAAQWVSDQGFDRAPIIH
jgi:hypothetical protein